MKLFKDFRLERPGNDCLIISAIALLEIRRNYYIVISTEKAEGNWAADEAFTSDWDFNSLEEAEAKYYKLKENLEHFA